MRQKMKPLTSLLADLSTGIAVVGATDNTAKYGSVIYRDLKRRGYRVWPVNPNRPTVDGDPAYDRIGDLPDQPDIIDLVVPAGVGLGVVREAIDLGWEGVWVQPGADSPELIATLQESGMEYIADSCIMVHSRRALG